MKIWLVTSGEPIPSENERPHRVGILSQMLVKKGHNVIWWTTTFDHQKKEYIFNENTEVCINENLKRVYLHSKTKYKKNISLERIFNHNEVAKDFKVSLSKYDLPDIIFCSFPTIDLAYISVKFGLQNNIPTIVDVRDLWPDIFLNPFPFILKPFIRFALFSYFTKTKYIFKNAYGITGVSKQYLNFGLNYGQREISERDKVFPLGFDSEGKSKIIINDKDFTQLNINSKYFNIWFVGTFGRTYDLSTVIKVARKLEKTNPNIKFIFTGDGENMDLWKKESIFLNNIIFTGWVGKNELHYISSKSHIGLMAYSKGAPQGLPNKIFEYMSAGLPILSSLQTETKELISNEKIGISYIPNNPNDLLLKLKTLINNEELLSEMQHNSINTFRGKFESEIIYENLIKFLIENKK